MKSRPKKRATGGTRVKVTRARAQRDADQVEDRTLPKNSQPAWFGGELDHESSLDWDQGDPLSSIPLDIYTRRDFASEDSLDHPGAWSRITFTDLIEAFASEMHCKQVFGITNFDDDLERAVLASIQHFTTMVKDPAATACGLFVGSLFIFMTSHRAFRRQVHGPLRGRV